MSGALNRAYRAYELIVTLGPASAEETIWAAMIAAGATAFRLNTSHLTPDALWGWLERLRVFFEQRGAGLPVILDLQGSKWRLGEFEPVDLQAGQTITLAQGKVCQTAGVIPVPHADFFKALAQSPGEVVLNDAKTRLQVEQVNDETVTARVVLGGRISPHKGITLPETAFRVESLAEKDDIIIQSTRGMEWVELAISYLRDAEELQRYMRWIGPERAVIAKLEREPAMLEAVEIAKSCAAVWVCRGDLGAEVGLARMAELVGAMSCQLASFSKPVVMAGQVLEHMTVSPTPTRSEVCYLYDALLAGYAGFVLSDEAAIGKFPLEAVKTGAMFMETNR